MTVIKQIHNQIMAMRRREAEPLVISISADIADQLVEESNGLLTYFGFKPHGLKGVDLKEVMGLTVQPTSGFAILKVQ